MLYLYCSLARSQETVYEVGSYSNTSQCLFTHLLVMKWGITVNLSFVRRFLVFCLLAIQHFIKYLICVIKCKQVQKRRAFNRRVHRENVRMSRQTERNGSHGQQLRQNSPNFGNIFVEAARVNRTARSRSPSRSPRRRHRKSSSPPPYHATQRNRSPSEGSVFYSDA